MGIDLFLLPIEPDSGEVAYAYTTLDVRRRSELWEPIRSLPSCPVPSKFFETLVSVEDFADGERWCCGNTQMDNHGQPLRWVYAKDLKALAAHPAVQDNHQNRAVWAYLMQLPDQTRVALYWY